MSSHDDPRFVAPGAVGYDRHHPLAAHPKIIDADQGIVETVPRRTKVAIVGFASSTMSVAPFEDPEYECWILNQLYRHVPRADRHFDIHRNWREGNVDGTDHPLWLRECGIPSYMTAREPGIPTSVCYPLARVTETVMPGLRYYTSTVAYMLALAIAEGFETIGIWGVDLIVGTEYERQKACVEFLLGVAHGRGIHVRLPARCALLKGMWLYGYEAEPDWGLNPSALKTWLDATQRKRQELLQQLYAVDGALQATEYWYAQMELKMRGGYPTIEQQLDKAT